MPRYYYDTETGLYYLQSRYYDANVGRFVNADGAVSTGVGLLGYNMFAYCNNNPIIFEDEGGNRPLYSDGKETELDQSRSIASMYTPGQNYKYVSGKKPKPETKPEPVPSQELSDDWKKLNSERISTLKPEVQTKAKEFISKAKD